MIRGNTSDFIGHPIPQDSMSVHGPPTTPAPRASHHLNPALQRWPWIRSAGVDSDRILCFSVGPGSGVKILCKTGPGVTF